MKDKGTKLVQFPSQSVLITICSFNIRFLTKKDKGNNHWNSRRERIEKFLLQKNFDFVGVQQATLPQRLDLLKSMTNKYNYYGKPRDQKDGEQCGICIREDKFTVIEDHYDWISQNKKQGEIGYDAALPRYFTTLLVTPKGSQKKQNRQKLPCLVLINVHLDHVGKVAKQKGLQQMVEKCISMRKKMEQKKIYYLLGCIIMGDFNLPEGSNELNILKCCQKMRFSSMRQIENADRSITFNGFDNNYLLKKDQYLIKNQRTIDHMFVFIKQKLIPLKFQVEKTNYFLSDHYPIVGTFAMEVNQ